MRPVPIIKAATWAGRGPPFSRSTRSKHDLRRRRLIVTDDDELASRIRSLKFHGLGVDAYDRQTHGRAPQAEVITPGFKYNLADINAALALVQLEN